MIIKSYANGRDKLELHLDDSAHVPIATPGYGNHDRRDRSDVQYWYGDSADVAQYMSLSSVEWLPYNLWNNLILYAAPYDIVSIGFLARSMYLQRIAYQLPFHLHRWVWLMLVDVQFLLAVLANVLHRSLVPRMNPSIVHQLISDRSPIRLDTFEWT